MVLEIFYELRLRLRGSDDQNLVRILDGLPDA